MTLKTWGKKFYPIPADMPMTDIEATKHSIQKWIGLRTDNQIKHNCMMFAGSCGIFHDKIGDYTVIGVKRQVVKHVHWQFTEKEYHE